MNETQLAVKRLNGEWPADHPQGSAKYIYLIRHPKAGLVCVDKVMPWYNLVCTKTEFMAEVKRIRQGVE